MNPTTKERFTKPEVSRIGKDTGAFGLKMGTPYRYYSCEAELAIRLLNADLITRYAYDLANKHASVVIGVINNFDDKGHPFTQLKTDQSTIKIYENRMYINKAVFAASLSLNISTAEDHLNSIFILRS